MCDSLKRYDKTNNTAIKCLWKNDFFYMQWLQTGDLKLLFRYNGGIRLLFVLLLEMCLIFWYLNSKNLERVSDREVRLVIFFQCMNVLIKIS